eukprot:EG_transcript_26643
MHPTPLPPPPLVPSPPPDAHMLPVPGFDRCHQAGGPCVVVSAGQGYLALTCLLPFSATSGRCGYLCPLLTLWHWSASCPASPLANLCTCKQRRALANLGTPPAVLAVE